MSAYIESNFHIEYLVNAAMARNILRGAAKLYWYAGEHRRELNPEDAQAVGQMLLDENYRSVNCRYSRKDEPSAYGPHRFDGNNFDPVQVLKALSGYEYQCCETSNWEKTEAHDFCRALRAHAIEALPGYEDAEWSICQRIPYRAVPSGWAGIVDQPPACID